MVSEPATGGVEGRAEPRLAAPPEPAIGGIASAHLGTPLDGQPPLRSAGPGAVSPDTAPVAVELELWVKGARGLEAVCGVWARCPLLLDVHAYPADRLTGGQLVRGGLLSTPHPAALRLAG